MSRREGRDSDSRRHRSRFDQEPSPKRSRRDGKPATERPPRNINLDSGEHSDSDKKHRRRLQDALPLEASVAPDAKVETESVSKESDKKSNGHHEGTKHSSDPNVVPRSRSYYQHDERGNAGRVGRSFSQREAAERGWWKESKDQQRVRATNRAVTNDTKQREEKSQVQNDNHAWSHDRYFEVEADPKPPARKRSFREQKIQVDSANVAKPATEPVKPIISDRLVLGSGRREERGGQSFRHSDRPEKPFAEDKEANRGEAQRGNFSSRDRYGSNYRGRERFNGRQGYRPGGVRVEKWKHDLFHEANRSPTPKNEEDQIAKVEALLAS